METVLRFEFQQKKLVYGGIPHHLDVWMDSWIDVEVKTDPPNALPESFVPVMMTGTFFGYAFCIAMLSWTLAGFEIINVNTGVIEIGRKIFGLSRSEKYHTKDIKHLALVLVEKTVFGAGSQREFYSLHGNLKFDYGLKTVKFCSTDEAESRVLLELLRENNNFKESNFDQP